MTTVVTTCSACNRDNTAITDRECGEVVCSNCGAVRSEKIEDISNQERRTFSFEEADKRARTGAPLPLTLSLTSFTLLNLW
jgi:transcription initiation factor TFIIIB Brf1 subunit/transcription initiation factor TFIIB